jgi:uncharacterized protein YndB with AHSA1/START domain
LLLLEGGLVGGDFCGAFEFGCGQRAIVDADVVEIVILNFRCLGGEEVGERTGSDAMTSTLHTTLVFEREIAASLDAVFAAFADPVVRAKWGTPSDTVVVIYDQADFRDGGQDRFRCGSKTNPNIHGETRYLEITFNRRIVPTETITVDGKRLGASLTTVELTPDGKRTKLKNTTQLASFIGQDMIEGHTTGTNASLDNLVKYFER